MGSTVRDSESQQLKVTHRTWLEKARERLTPVIFFIFVGAQILDFLSISGLVLLVPQIAEKFNVETSQASWVLSAYSLTFGSFILLCGRMGDVLGHKVVFTGGMLL